MDTSKPSGAGASVRKTRDAFIAIGWAVLAGNLESDGWDEP